MGNSIDFQPEIKVQFYYCLWCEILQLEHKYYYELKIFSHCTQYTSFKCLLTTNVTANKNSK